MRCPRCGAETPVALANCEVCGAPLRRTLIDDDADARPSAWQPPLPGPVAPQPSPAPPFVSANPPVPRNEPPPYAPIPGTLPMPQPADRASIPGNHRTVLVAPGPAQEATVRQLRGVLLEYRGRNDPGKVHALHGGRTAIGRSADCDIVLDDHQASKQHAIIYIRGDDVSFMDVSSNGSIVDGRKVHGATATLQQGSTAVLGARLFVFLYVSERTLAGMK